MNSFKIYLLLAFAIFATISFLACDPEPKIPISNTLEIALGNDYSSYVKKLNASYDGDTTALVEFFKIGKIYDGASYDHGCVLLDLMKKNRLIFYKSLKKLSNYEREVLRRYIQVGLDRLVSPEKFITDFPEIFELLKISKEYSD